MLLLYGVLRRLLCVLAAYLLNVCCSVSISICIVLDMITHISISHHSQFSYGFRGGGVFAWYIF